MLNLNRLSNLLLIVFFLAFSKAGYSQFESERDSLESLLPFANDIQRADILNGLAECLRSTDTTKAGNYVRQALALSVKLNYCKGKATATIMLGVLQKNQGNLTAAKQYYLTGLSEALKCKEPFSVSYAYNSLGNLAYLEGDFKRAMRYYIGSVRISEQIKDFSRAARTYNNMGSLYMDLKDPAKAEQYYLRSLELFKGNDNELLVAEISNNLATIYQAKGYHLKALYHYSNALEVFRNKSSAADISSALNNIGLVYLDRKQARKALPYLNESYRLDLQVKEPKSILLVLNNLTAAYLQVGMMDSSRYFLEQGLLYAQKFPSLIEVSEIYGSAAEIYSRLNDKAKSEYYRNLKQMAEKANQKSDEKNEIGLLTAEYENQRKQNELKLLQKEGEIKDLRLVEQQMSIERRNIYLIATLLVIFFLLLISGLLIYMVNLNRKSKLFELSNKAKSSMLHQINHEIRTPLNGIVGMSQLALESKTFTELKDYLTHIKLSSDELMFVLNNLITYLQLERKEANPVAAPFDLLETFEDLFRIYSFQCKSKGLLFNQMVYPGVPLKVNADKQKFVNIIQNLLSNAVKHSSKGVVKVEVKQSAQRVKDNAKLSTLQISVIDEGPGLTEKEIKQVFKAIPQVSDKSNGFGIGLRNVKLLCDLMKGHIEVISEKGVGTSFIVEIELEVIEDARPELAGNIKPNRIIDPSKYLILVAEDNQLNQRLFAKILEKEGYPYLIADNGLKALSLLQEKSFDLILMDIRMPEMDGIEATHHIRTREEFAMDRHIPIIAVTAHDDAEEKKKCFDVGMNEYLTKPINKEILVAKIAEQLSLKGQTV